jgi:hypothetical protein
MSLLAYRFHSLQHSSTLIIKSSCFFRRIETMSSIEANSSVNMMINDFDYIADIQLVVCIRCGHCVWANEIATHLQNNTKHESHSSREAENTQNLVQERWPIAYSYQNGPNKVEDIITNKCSAYPHLTIYHDGI